MTLQVLVVGQEAKERHTPIRTDKRLDLEQCTQSTFQLNSMVRVAEAIYVNTVKPCSRNFRQKFLCWFVGKVLLPISSGTSLYRTGAPAQVIFVQIGF